MKNANRTLRVGLAGVGLAAYWPQFPGLAERLDGYLTEVELTLASARRTVVPLGMVDSAEKAIAAGHRCRREDIDILLVYATTYALSANILPMLQRAKVPIVLLNVQPLPAMDYARLNTMDDRTRMTGEWLAFCGSCPVPEIANVLRRLDMPFHQVTGMLQNDPEFWHELEDWLLAAAVQCELSHARLGLLGHYYSGMLDISTDLVQVSGRFGCVVEQLELDELSRLRRDVSSAEAETMVDRICSTFQVEPTCLRSELDRAARTAVALERLTREHQLSMLAYYHMGTGVADNENVMSSIILGATLLTSSGTPVAGEYEVKNAIAMKIMDLLGTGGSFTEFYALDFTSDVVLMGHDGPGHARIANGKVRVRSLPVYHGKVGSGLSVEMSVQHGPVTLLSVVEDRAHGFQLLVAEGESVPGEILEIGNTNSRYRFQCGARRFVEEWSSQGPAHHCTVGLGHCAATLCKLAELLQVGYRQIC